MQVKLNMCVLFYFVCVRMCVHTFHVCSLVCMQATLYSDFILDVSQSSLQTDRCYKNQVYFQVVLNEIYFYITNILSDFICWISPPNMSGVHTLQCGVCRWCVGCTAKNPEKESVLFSIMRIFFLKMSFFFLKTANNSPFWEQKCSFWEGGSSFSRRGQIFFSLFFAVWLYLLECACAVQCASMKEWMNVEIYSSQ